MANHTSPWRNEAVLWEPLDGKRVRCGLCAWHCVIAAGHRGRCRVRQNQDGVLVSLVYDKVCAAHDDPIEKKPLFHFQPGSRSFSIAAPGCNFQCVFCQNWQISQMPQQQNVLDGQSCPPEAIVQAALDRGCRSMAYTYTEPTIFMELCADTGRLAKARGLRNVFVSNGFMTRSAIDFARPWLDAINIDLKAFTEDYYRDLCKARLEPVLEAIRYIARETDIWLELTTLLIPGKNDSDDELRAIARFIAEEASVEVPWHISRFVPQYKMNDTPPTGEQSLKRAFEIGKEAGLRYVYLGNLPGAGGESTVCHACGAVLIERFGCQVRRCRLDHGRCPDCGAAVAGVEMERSPASG